MENRKNLINEYKQRKIVGGVFQVTNNDNGMYLLDFATDIQAKNNAFTFSASSGSCFDYKLRQDWQECGAGSFAFEILDRLEKKKEQSQDQFIDDLKMLEALWLAKLDPSKRY